MADGGAQRKRTGTRQLTEAQRWDLHDLYEEAVQDVEQECDFLRATFRDMRGREPRSLREDFCGTGRMACAWVSSDQNATAVAVDLDSAVLDWGRRRHVAALTPAERQRIEYVHSNVLDVRTQPVDVLAALNFSYWVFKTRADLLRYFRCAFEALAPDGVLYLDAYGGYDAYREMRETTDHEKFKYIWHQAKYYPVTGEILCYINFQFPDGSKIDRAFTYDWRIWSLPELREVLAEAGFSRSRVYWEGTADDGSGNGEFSPVEKGDADAGWVAYVIAEK